MTETVTSEILERIAQQENTTPAALDFILHEYIDPEALNTLVNQSSSAQIVKFEVPEYEVTISGQNDIEIQPLESGSSSDSCPLRTERC
ncbi:HalOD1 output domain-containing protein [Haloarcula litorea]|uniref:HalOD1 output domain-containing protein n=1 Tax=Haloarcula litorea TaxID=3032579 RepID=UPI0023E899F6|nr:HalOD1 output domain-containing protein [Halomicroarcula sp. GDY20]